MITKKRLSLYGIVALLIGLFLVTSTTSLAEKVGWPALSSSKYIKVYTISTGNNTPAYDSKSTSKKIGTIYASDELYVYSISGSWVYLSYPTSSGRKKAYVPLSTITSATATSFTATSARATITTYRRASTTNSFGSISKGDTVLFIATSGNYVQVLYPISGGYKLGWVTKANYDSYIAAVATTPTANTTTVNSKVTTTLDRLIKGTESLKRGNSSKSIKDGSNWGDWQKGTYGIQCKAFATAVFYHLFGYDIGPYPNSAKHTISINPAKTSVIFSIKRPGTQNDLANKLKAAKPGDFIQMNKSTSQHSMIVYSVASNGLYIYDANSDGKNTIKKQFRDWAYFYNYMGSSNYGISLYRAK